MSRRQRWGTSGRASHHTKEDHRPFAPLLSLPPYPPSRCPAFWGLRARRRGVAQLVEPGSPKPCELQVRVLSPLLIQGRSPTLVGLTPGPGLRVEHVGEGSRCSDQIRCSQDRGRQPGVRGWPAGAGEVPTCRVPCPVPEQIPTVRWSGLGLGVFASGIPAGLAGGPCPGRELRAHGAAHLPA